MKIGQFAKQYGTTISTIRHYIDIGLLSPQKNGSQYNFMMDDCGEMEMILEMKDAGFSLRELQKYINVTRQYDSKDVALNEKLLRILHEKYDAMLQERKVLLEHMRLISKKIKEIELSASSGNETDSVQSFPGIPLDFVVHLRCPYCKKPLNLSHVAISDSTIRSGEVHCACGYTAAIKDGMIFAGTVTYTEDDHEFANNYYGGNPLQQNFDSMLFECVDTASPQFLALLHKSHVRMHEMLKKQGTEYPFILFPDISTHFLYHHYDAAYINGAAILVVALTENSIRPMRQKLRSLKPDLNIIYIINQDGKLPLEDELIDLVVDFYGMSNLSFFSKTPELDKLSRYLKMDASVIQGVDYYAAGAKSLQNIQKLYPNALEDNLKLFTFKKILYDNGFQIMEEEVVGHDFMPGEYFEYHEPGETRNARVLFAKRTI